MLGLVLGATLAAAPAAIASPSTATLDLTRTGSISVALETADANVMSDGELSLYQVATYFVEDGSMAYTLAAGFEDCTADATSEDSAASFATFAQTATPLATKAVSWGTVKFNNLACGIYLVVQTQESEIYESIEPFLVSVPFAEGDEWVYAVDAEPKVGFITEKADEDDEVSGGSTGVAVSLGSRLPQTGQLWWPVAALVLAGLVLLLAGAVLGRTRKE